jgi:uncharacterized protein (DUF2252 family)
MGMSSGRTLAAAQGCVRAYREHMHEYARMPALEVWYARLDLDMVLRLAPDRTVRKRWREEVVRARPYTPPLENLTEKVHGQRRLGDHRPLLYHPSKGESFERNFPTFFALYRDSLPDDRRVLLDRYRLVDVAMKVVGIGSVGTRCAVALLEEEQRKQPLFLQFKEAERSVLAPYAGRSLYPNQGQRVVAGQRLMQAASDILLGWSRVETKRHQFDFYFRQLRERKESVDLGAMSAAGFADYAALCGWALARAHARSGDAACIAGYAGKGAGLDRAIAAFAVAYAEQVERDHAHLAAAVRAGKVAAERLRGG